MEGKVKWYNPNKGFGFITCPDGSDIFVHKSDVGTQVLKEGDKVEFEVGQAPKGTKAINVVKV